MPTPSSRMGLSLPTQADKFSTADIRSNWEKLDAAPGIHICTSTTRPAWTASQVGRKILETNTGLEWLWTGTTWQRSTGGQGILKRTDGSAAIMERVTNFSSGSETFIRVIQLPGVVVPAGRRPVQMIATWYQADNNRGPFPIAIFRSNQPDSGPVLGKTQVGIFPSTNGAGGSLICFERFGLPPGTYDFSLQTRVIPSIGGTATIYGDSVQPVQLTIIEM